MALEIPKTAYSGKIREITLGVRLTSGLRQR